ncbi:MAG: hypothetical protein AB1637_02170 [Elusimicrobiota bacterium]
MKKSVLKFIISLYIFGGIALSAQDCGVWPTLSSPEIYMDRPYVNGVYYTFSGDYISLGLNINTACDLCRSIYFTTATARIGNEELEASNNYVLIPADKIIEEGEYEVSMSVIAHSPCDSTEREYSSSTLLKVDNTPPIVEIRIYGVGGELVKKHTIIGSPNISSPDYAYRWEWSGAKTSGVYFYTIESRKGSGKIKKQGKFAVIK